MLTFKIKSVLFLLGCVFLILNGCATVTKRNLQEQQLRNQIQVLEAELKQKDDEIAYLKNILEKSQQLKTSVGYSPEAKSRPSVKQIQIALKNAGYNPGPIDGKMGRQTRQAIRAFQKANGLVPDGRVGKKTWTLLKEYLYKKSK